MQNEDGTPTPLAAQLSEEFYQVMVDEYQDTNALQDTLYHCLAKPDGSNLFFVGDLKQSIYRFRQADPTIFQQKLDRFVEYGQPGPQKLFLDANFRSAPGVIGGVNAIFTPLMSRKLGGVDYGPGERLVPGLGELENYGGYAGDCEFRLVQSERPAGDAEYIARRIRQLMDPASGFTVRGETGPRPPRLSRISASCCAAAAPSGITPPGWKVKAFRCMWIGRKTCWTRRRSARWRAFCGCWTTPRRTCIWRR